MKVKIKKLSDSAVIPFYSRDGDAGLDFTTTGRVSTDRDIITYGTSIALEIPKGFVGLIFPRSSAYKYSLVQSNCVGVVDSNYRGEIFFKMRLTGNGGDIYSKGDRIGQLLIIPYPNIEFEEVDELSESNRGILGYGSSGN